MLHYATLSFPFGGDSSIVSSKMGLASTFYYTNVTGTDLPDHVAETQDLRHEIRAARPEIPDQIYETGDTGSEARARTRNTQL